MLTFFLETMQKWISNKARQAGTDCVVIDNLAVSRESARAWTRVNARLSNASLVLRAVCADDALWTAVGCGAVVAGLARAESVVVDRATHAVRATRARNARV